MRKNAKAQRRKDAEKISTGETHTQNERARPAAASSGETQSGPYPARAVKGEASGAADAPIQSEGEGSSGASPSQSGSAGTLRPTLRKGKAKCVPGANRLLLPYQAKWVADRSRLKIAEKSRQIGWTWAAAYDLVRKLSASGAVLDEWISSRDDLQAKLFIQDMKNWARVVSVGAEDLGEVVLDDKNQSAMTIRFATGCYAYSLSSNADAQAGKRGGRTLDEFALHRDPRNLYSIAYPGITWGGQLAIFSTHRGTANFFNELIQEIRHKGNPKGFSYHRVTLQDALEQGFLHRLQSKLPADDERQGMDEAAYFDFIKRGAADEESFLQEYMCIPGDDASAFLSYDLIAGCEYALSEPWERTLAELATMQDLFIGVDVGRKNDLTVMPVLHKVGGVYFTRKVVVMQRESFDAQEAALYELLELPGVRRCCIDETGIGMQFAERAQKRFGEHKVEAVRFSGPVKEELAYPVRAAFEDRSIRIPNDAATRKDLRGIRKEVTASGNIRFTADSGPDGHSDRFWAYALALHAGKSERPGVIVPVKFSKFGVVNAWRAERSCLG